MRGTLPQALLVRGKSTSTRLRLPPRAHAKAVMRTPHRPELWYRVPGHPLRSGTCICRLQSALRSDPGTTPRPAHIAREDRIMLHAMRITRRSSLVHLTGGLLGPSGAPCLHPKVGLASNWLQMAAGRPETQNTTSHGRRKGAAKKKIPAVILLLYKILQVWVGPRFARFWCLSPLDGFLSDCL